MAMLHNRVHFAEIPDIATPSITAYHVELATVARHPEADIHRCHTEIAPGY
jgi:hypothetical protein